MMKKVIGLIAIISVFLFCLSSCSQTPEKQGEKSEVIQQSKKNETELTERPEFTKQTFWLWLAIIVSDVCFVASFVFLWKRSDKDRIKDIVFCSKRLEQKFLRAEEWQALKQNNNNIEDKLINQIVDLVIPRILECIKLEQQETGNKDNSQSLQYLQSNVKYLKEKKGDILSHETSNAEEGMFKLTNIERNEAKFEFAGTPSSIVSFDYFDRACEFVNNPQNVNPITEIKTIEKGETQLQPDGTWKVIKKARIKFV
jgi:hypothetical protein